MTEHPLSIFPLSAYEDNYIWVLQLGRNVVVVDPGDATPVIALLNQQQLQLTGILVTHHHQDHIGGVSALVAQYKVPVYAPAYGQYNFHTTPVKEGDSIYLAEIKQFFSILWLPGHTLDHIAFVNAQHLFCGDTLFSAGCGRLFEGTPQQMLTSLNTIKQLPAHTKVYCTHEYTLKNLAFALTVEPDNLNLISKNEHAQSLRAQQLPTLPSTIGDELDINPFLRCHEATIQKNLALISASELAVFTQLREMRNHY